jgi:hypothetical protein
LRYRAHGGKKDQSFRPKTNLASKEA